MAVDGAPLKIADVRQQLACSNVCPIPAGEFNKYWILRLHTNT